jgi:hypothetical protein
MSSEKLNSAIKARLSEIEVEIGVLVQERESLNKFLGNQNHTSEPIKKTGQYWFKNRFSPEQGFSTIEKGFRVLYHYQDEGPNFVTDNTGYPKVWPNIDEARKYIKDSVALVRSCMYTIIAADGEIVS